MKVSINWLKELVDLKISVEELVKLLPLRTIGTKEVTNQYIELDMKGYNRADLLSLRGVAREVAAITNSKVIFEDAEFPEFNLPQTPVKVENPNLCPVYCIAKIEGLKVNPSDRDWVQKLEESGIRTVNNVADITNLMMVEYGQPMHAFDEQKVTGSINVRVAKKDEKIITLDGKARNLSKDDLLITDENGPIGIAGVMGGKDSEISEETTSILLEAAIFDPVTIRKTSQKHGLYSEASKRFQHGLTKTNLLEALTAAIKMYESLGGKLTAITFVGNLEDEVKIIKLTQEKINSLIGVEIPSTEVESSLKKLGFSLKNEEVTVPYWRLDINIEEDLIEEVARMYGYEKIPATPLADTIPNTEEKPLFKTIEELKQALSQAGLTEVQTYSFYSTQVTENCKLKTENLIKVANPISSETEYLRDNLWPNLLEVAAKNIKQGFKDIAIFEIGKVYSPKIGELPNEVYHLSIILINGTDNPILELHQITKSLNSHPKGVKLISSEYSHPTRHTDELAEIHPRIVNKFGIEQRVAVLEIEIKEIL